MAEVLIFFLGHVTAKIDSTLKRYYVYIYIFFFYMYINIDIVVGLVRF